MIKLINHGSPADRGSADRYYGRGFHPHEVVNGVRNENLTAEQIDSYRKGYASEQDRKEWD
jgi:hypothetical protein